MLEKMLPAWGGGPVLLVRNKGRKPVLDEFFLFHKLKFGMLNIFKKILA